MTNEQGQTTQRPLLTIKDAARATNVSRSTLRRRLGEGAFPNAEQEGGVENGAWLIPPEDLIAAGFRLNAPTREGAQVTAVSMGTDQASDVREQVIDLREQVVRLQGEKAVAEAKAEERLRTIVNLENAMRMLDAGPQPARASWAGPTEQGAARPTTAPVRPVSTPPAKRRWWHRRQGSDPLSLLIEQP